MACGFELQSLRGTLPIWPDVAGGALEQPSDRRFGAV